MQYKKDSTARENLEAVWAPLCLSGVFSFDKASTVCAHASGL